MKRIAQALALFNVILYVSYACVYYYAQGSNIKPLYWYFFTILSTFCIVAPKLPALLWELPKGYAIWLWLFSSYCIVSFLYSSQSDIAIAAYVDGTEMAALLLALALLFMLDGAARVARVGLLFVVLFGIAVNWMDFFDPTWGETQGRAAGFYDNPNLSGKILVLAMVATIGLVPRILRFPYCLLVGIGIVVTFSRGSWLTWAVALVSMAGYGILVFRHRTSAAIALILLSGVIVYGVMAGSVLGVFKNIGLADHLTERTEARLGSETGLTGEYEYTGERIAVAREAWAAIEMNPWFGHGLGYTAEWELDVRPHNMYLLFAVEGGLFGLAIFISLLVALWRSEDEIGRVFILTFAVSSVFTHNNLEDPATLLLLTFVAVTGRRAYIATSNRDQILAPQYGLTMDSPLARRI